ncbi:EamA family transporter [Agathobaculum sp. NTUH-O15-33]|uniref:EamA family transporter n=1 Tax=Agathobaculum sp. NTUH-O15-33 TaxID=3079302 RepID=UPI0029585FCB|nr:EamA family transporter [Agathobaculum sp. NTUH-O15-33]WNX84088.1 EamA family transporter [Agathobaculum sp. NTUH-O15-33]
MKMTLLCLLNTCLMATGQMLFKIGSAGKAVNSLFEIVKLFFTPIVFIALCLYAATTGLWLFILSRTPMSHAYPIQALAFPIVLFASMLFFHEHISGVKWLGIAVIVFGVFIATRG